MMCYKNIITIVLKNKMGSTKKACHSCRAHLRPRQPNKLKQKSRGGWTRKLLGANAKTKTK